VRMNYYLEHLHAVDGLHFKVGNNGHQTRVAVCKGFSADS
jgi:hypothetical protein